MYCTSCGNNELTIEEERSETQRCMLCVMIRVNKYADALDWPEEKRRVDRNKYGRSAEEYEEFQSLAKNMEPSPIVSALDQLVTPGKSPTSKKPGSSFEQAVNSQIGTDVFSKVKTRKITANGLTEDIQLTLTVPEVYPIREEYYKSTEILLTHTLEYILHLLAFGPMAGKDWEAYLMEKIQDAKNKGGGPVGY